MSQLFLGQLGTIISHCTPFAWSGTLPELSTASLSLHSALSGWNSLHCATIVPTVKRMQCHTSRTPNTNHWFYGVCCQHWRSLLKGLVHEDMVQWFIWLSCSTEVSLIQGVPHQLYLPSWFLTRISSDRHNILYQKIMVLHLQISLKTKSWCKQPFSSWPLYKQNRLRCHTTLTNRYFTSF